MIKARIQILAVALLLPFLARLPFGLQWTGQYTKSGIHSILFLEAFNLAAWVPLILASFLLKRTYLLWVAAVPSLVFLARAHASLDLGSDAQAAVSLVFIPIYSLPFAFLGIGMAFLLQKFSTRS